MTRKFTEEELEDIAWAEQREKELREEFEDSVTLETDIQSDFYAESENEQEDAAMERWSEDDEFLREARELQLTDEETEIEESPVQKEEFKLLPDLYVPEGMKATFSVDIGDLPEEKGTWQDRVPTVPAPEQESMWPFYLDIVLKLAIVFLIIMGIAHIVTGPH